MRKAIVLSLLMVGGAFVPLATASHMSVGTMDAVGVAPEENPDDPTVDDDALERGTTSPSECDVEDPEAIEDPSDVEDNARSDAFCSHLYYNADTNYIRESPKDQNYPLGTDGPVGSFDVVYGAYVGNYGLSTCIPWCFPPGGGTAYDVLHNTLAEHTDLAEDSEAVRENERTGWQEYAANIIYPNAFQTAQQETGVWEMNGFVFTQPDQRFIGFLEDEGGDPISRAELESIHEDLAPTDDLSADTVPFVCGFTPDFQISINAPQASFCEVLFAWSSEDGDVTDGADFKPDDYNNQCESPTYVCGGVTEAWYARLVCASFSGAASTTPISGCGKTPNEYEAWHWVVAPAVSDCSGAVEPGFQIEADTTGQPYLAHDLDVYTPFATAADNNGTENVEQAIRETVDSTLPVTVGTGGLTSTANQAAAELAPREVSKVDRIEPNAPGDTSQTFEVDRPATAESCDQVRPGSEEVFDPWRSVIDNQMTFDAIGEPLGLEGGEDLYLNDRSNQDASNRPGYGQYFPTGFVGMFADKNDDGDYDRVGSNNKLQSIQETGAYPMIWDISMNATKLDETGDPDQAMEGGCQPGFSDVLWTDAAKEGGYGPETGLVQVVYLNEPSYLYHWETGEVFPFPAGGTAFVSLTDNFVDFRETGVNLQVVEEHVQTAIDEIPSATMDDVFYTHELTSSSIRDFNAQCTSATGGFTSQWGFGHTCGGEPGSELCAGDTVVTQYHLDVADSEGILGGSGSPIPTLTVDGDDVSFSDAPTVWTDVDAFDGDPDRNDDTCDRPEHHTAEDDGEDRRGQQIDESERYPCGHQH